MSTATSHLPAPVMPRCAPQRLLQGQKALVTGASSGIGRGIALALDIESGRASVAAAGDAVRAATEARRVVGERYQAGVITQFEVLDAEYALLQAELDRTRALAGVRLAEARLARAMGR